MCQCALLSVVGGRGGVRKEGEGQKVKKGAKKVEDWDTNYVLHPELFKASY